MFVFSNYPVLWLKGGTRTHWEQQDTLKTLCKSEEWVQKFMREASLIMGKIPDALAEVLEQAQMEASTLWQGYKATFPVDTAEDEQQRIL